LRRSFSLAPQLRCACAAAIQQDHHTIRTGSCQPDLVENKVDTSTLAVLKNFYKPPCGVNKIGHTRSAGDEKVSVTALSPATRLIAVGEERRPFRADKEGHAGGPKI
jgi:hypothetical protein